jgi:ankyrin repeat protein
MPHHQVTLPDEARAILPTLDPDCTQVDSQCQHVGCAWINIHNKYSFSFPKVSRTGLVPLLKYASLKYPNREWGPDAASTAAEFGHYACLRFLHEVGCEWDVRTPVRAAAGGHLECLKYAVSHGCPVTEAAVMSAARAGHHECVRWLRGIR